MTEQAKVPEIRFAGFTDPWEQRKLGELTESYSGGTPAAGESEFYGGSIPFIRSAEIAAESTELFLTEKGYESSSARMVKPGDVLCIVRSDKWRGGCIEAKRCHQPSYSRHTPSRRL